MTDDLALYAHAAPPDRLRLWVGVRNADHAPTLTFEVDDQARPAAALKGLAPVWPSSRVHTGIFEIDKLTPDTRYRVRVRTDGGLSQTLTTRTLPASLDGPDPFRVLLVSCYHRDEDKHGLLRQLEGRIPSAARPNLVLLAGDQVYLDLPTERNFPKDVDALAKIFEQNYVANWFDSSLTSALRMAPILCAPDDHEYWNNYPDRATIVQNTWSPDGRLAWETAASAMYTAFQLSAGVAIGEGMRRDVTPLSFYVLDTRSTRGAGATRMLAANHLTAFQAWASSLGPEHIGVLLTGQSLLSPAVSKLGGKVADWELANYETDYAKILTAIHEAARKARGFVLLTGDVHWGRVTSVEAATGTLLHEIISSPTALVTNVATDTFREIFGWVARREWPRHATASTPPDAFGMGILPQTFGTRMRHPQQGDQAALIEMTRRGEINVTYYPLSRTSKVVAPIQLVFKRA